MVIPVEPNAKFSSVSNWVIRSAPPRPDRDDVFWERTEVLDDDGRMRMIIEGAFAKRLA
jgi:hypothetical protein